MSPNPSLVPVSDHGVLVVFDKAISDETRSRVHALDTAFVRNPPTGVLEVVPAMTTLLVVFDPLLTDHAAIGAAIHTNLDASQTIHTGATHVIDICYDGEHAPDLPVLAARVGVDTETAVAAHLAAIYTVGMYGFAPGYAYLYGTPEPIQQPRNPTPGPLVPAGSVIVAGEQCLIIPVAMSTGWFAIGMSPVSMYTADHARPFLLDVGDTVTFRRIDADELDARLGAPEMGVR
jgi:inhibitor of KinA